MDETLLTKQQWIEEYVSRILEAFIGRESRIGLDEEYVSFVRSELNEYYDSPPKKAMIESSYPPEYARL